MQQTQLAASPIATPLSSLPIEPSVWYVSSARGDCDWSEPATAISFPYRKASDAVSASKPPNKNHRRILGEKKSLLKENSIRKSPLFILLSSFLHGMVSHEGVTSHLDQQPSRVCEEAHFRNTETGSVERLRVWDRLCQHRASTSCLVSPISRLPVTEHRVFIC